MKNFKVVCRFSPDRIKRKIEYWFAWWNFRFHVKLDKFKIWFSKSTESFKRLIKSNLYLLKRKARKYRVDFSRPDTSTNSIKCLVVNRQAYVFQSWALKGTLTLLIVSLMTHLPAPRQVSVYINDTGDTVKLEMERYQHRAELAETVAEQQSLRAEQYQELYNGLRVVVERYRKEAKQSEFNKLVKKINQVNPNADAEYLANLMFEASEVHGVPVEFIRPISEIESHFNVNAGSKAGAKGVMQVMPSWSKWCPNLGTVRGDIHCGTRILKYECRRASNLHECLGKYNGADSPSSQARYVNKFLKAYKSKS